MVLTFDSDGKITSEIDGQKYEIEIHTVHTHGDELSFGITVNGKRSFLFLSIFSEYQFLDGMSTLWMCRIRQSCMEFLRYV